MKRNETVIAITVKGLTKSFKNTPVLRGVDFEVDRGSVFAMLGSNGAGKTTTIKILTTLLRPDEGSAKVCGFDVLKQPESVREVISLTGQNVAADYILTGRENLRLIGKLRHLHDINSRAEALLARFDLQKDADKRISEYSGGMKRKLDLAMSLMGSPSVVFLDEPTVGLHMADVEKLLHVLHKLVDDGNTIVVIEHNLDVIAEADWIIDLGPEGGVEGGTIVAQGTPEGICKVKGSHTAKFLKEFHDVHHGH
jgi:ABC-2 type transport system ATP-binding protein